MRDIIPFFMDRSSIERSLADELGKLTNEIFGKDFFPGALARGSYPKMNVYDKDNTLCVDAYVPDLPKDKIHMEVKEGILTIKGDSNQDREISGEKYYCREVSKRAFSRGVKLPDDIDDSKITAKLDDGMLKIRIPYAENRKKEDVKNIEIE
jgi:HSP20 family protein